MPEFLKLLPPDQALKLFRDHLSLQPSPEEVDTVDALGRVNFAPIVAPYPLPSFQRSTVDGYAVRAAETYGASESLPAYLQLYAEILMGQTPGFVLPAGCCALIHTGGMLPENADAVVMIENTQLVPARSGQNVEILRAAAIGENIIKVGEDVYQGQEVIPSGAPVRPAEIGGLMALGLTRLKVARQPRVAIISSGDEVVPPDAPISAAQVRDVNSYSLGALVKQSGGLPVCYGIVPDQASVLAIKASQALEADDMLVITAGSSASARDLTSQVIADLGKPGVLVHGVNVRPGKPTILAVCDGKPVIGLPGNPVSALVIAWLFVRPVIWSMLGLRHMIQQPSIPARMSINLASSSGREEWIAVCLRPGPDGMYAEPVFGKSNLIFTLARADGLVRLPADATGLNAGENVEVILF